LFQFNKHTRVFQHALEKTERLVIVEIDRVHQSGQPVAGDMVYPIRDFNFNIVPAVFDNGLRYRVGQVCFDGRQGFQPLEYRGGQRIHARALAHVSLRPRDASGWYWLGYALTRHAQGIHVARALAQGIGAQIRIALDTALRLAPGHAYAHAVLGGFQAEIIDKVGPLVAAMTYGARAETALSSLRQAQRLAPDSAAILMDSAAALLMLDNRAHQAEAARLHEQAAQVQPRDAAERLWVELARASLAL
jgi:hypothetical protein